MLLLGIVANMWKRKLVRWSGNQFWEFKNFALCCSLPTWQLLSMLTKRGKCVAVTCYFGAVTKQRNHAKVRTHIHQARGLPTQCWWSVQSASTPISLSVTTTLAKDGRCQFFCPSGNCHQSHSSFKYCLGRAQQKPLKIWWPVFGFHVIGDASARWGTWSSGFLNDQSLGHLNHSLPELHRLKKLTFYVDTHTRFVAKMLLCGFQCNASLKDVEIDQSGMP